MDTITTMFALTVAEGALAMISTVGIVRYHFVNVKLRADRAEALEALHNEQTEGAHFRELADDALANIETLRTQALEAQAAAGRWAGKYTEVSQQLRRIEEQSNEAAASRKVRMRTIGIIGNRSPKRRRNSAAA